MVKRAGWLSVTPEPERELPAAVVTLERGARPTQDAVAKEAARVEQIRGVAGRAEGAPEGHAPDPRLSSA